MHYPEEYRRRERIILLVTKREKAAIESLAARTVQHDGKPFEPSAFCRELISLAVQKDIHLELNGVDKRALTTLHQLETS